MRLDGSRPRRVTNDPAYDAWPVWSPCGTRVLFTSWRDGDGEIFVMDIDRGNLQKLTDNDSEDEFPSWQPTGTSNRRGEE